VHAFVDAAQGHPKTLTFVETENGSISGGYLDVAWVDGGYANDHGARSFIFTLRNHLGIPPTMFRQKRDALAAFMSRDNFSFGFDEGFEVGPGNCLLYKGRTYEAPDAGVAVFNGDECGVFRAARWELWTVD
jgi:hypothetical protein